MTDSKAVLATTSAIRLRLKPPNSGTSSETTLQVTPSRADRAQAKYRRHRSARTGFDIYLVCDHRVSGCLGRCARVCGFETRSDRRKTFAYTNLLCGHGDTGEVADSTESIGYAKSTT